MAEKLVRDVMHKGVITCGPRTSLRDVARIMIKHDIREIAVCTYRTSGLCGLISDWLLAQSHGLDLNRLVAEDILPPSTVAVSPETTLTHAIELLQTNRIPSLAVVVADSENGHLHRPIGIVSSYDIIREMAEVELVFPFRRTQQQSL
jgi:CBS domain-containing protein